MNNHLVGKTDILEPRAKIGDVVIVSGYWYEDEYGNPVNLTANNEELTVSKSYSRSQPNLRYYESNDKNFFRDKDILKNLTTNVSYE